MYLHTPNSRQYLLQFADDTALITHDYNRATAVSEIQRLIDLVCEWFRKWHIKINPSKTQFLIFNHRVNENSPTVRVDNEVVSPASHAKYLGINLDHQLNFRLHGKRVKQSTITRANYFKCLSTANSGLGWKHRVTIYKAICRPILDYGAPILFNGNQRLQKLLQVAETSALREITRLRHPNNILFNPSNALLYTKSDIVPIFERIA